MATIETRRNADGTISYRAKVRLRVGKDTETFARKTDAREWAARREIEIKDGHLFRGTRKTLADAVERYLREELPRLATTGQNGRRLHLEWWTARRGSELLTSISRPAILDDLRQLRKTGPKGRPVKFATANRYKAALGAVLSCAVEDWHWLPIHPLRGGGRRKRPKGDREDARERELVGDEKERLWKACRESRDTRLFALVVLAFHSGARQGELMGLEWARVQLHPTVRDSATGERRPGVPRAEVLDTKSGKSRILYFPGEAADVLRSLAPRLSLYVFAGPRDETDELPTFPRHAWGDAVRAAGMSNFRFHDLRHCWACAYLEEGSTLPQLMVAGGWEGPSQVMRYASRAMREGSTPAELQDRMARR